MARFRGQAGSESPGPPGGSRRLHGVRRGLSNCETRGLSRWVYPVLGAWAAVALAATTASGSPSETGRIPAEVRLEGDSLRFDLARPDGSIETLDLDGLRARLAPPPPRPILERVLNVDGPAGVAWVVFGLAGQVLFAGRMVVQWLVSERKGESTVPVVFWWLSLGGSSMLVAYFAWRGDIVGILGQSLGLFIYVRNLVLIRRSAMRSAVAAAEVT